MMDDMRLIQLKHAGSGRRVALVSEPDLVLLEGFETTYDLAMEATRHEGRLSSLVESSLSDEKLPYDPAYAGASEWRILPCFDHPGPGGQCLVSGTGLTHRKSAAGRQKMHEADQEEDVTDSMRMYLSGLQGGRPGAGEIGVSPEWFYKGGREVLRGHQEALCKPSHADDGGEEAEVAGLYLIDDLGLPWRVGLAQGNEFSDHRLEKQNYLYLASSKLRSCSIGPELLTGRSFSSVTGMVRIERSGQTVWSREIASGDENMCHSLENIEHHHFKHRQHRQPGGVHIHFLGADTFSFTEGLQLLDGDVMEISWEGFGRPLRNSLLFEADPPELFQVKVMD